MLLLQIFNTYGRRDITPSPDPGAFNHIDFSRSAVRQEDGTPLPVYHATLNGFEHFKPLSHFGTRDAAEHRMRRTYLDDPNYAENGYWGIQYDARYIRAELNIQNPLPLPDLGGHEWYHYSEALQERGLITEAEAQTIFAENNEVVPGWEIRLCEHLMRLGYDGFTYTNEVEDEGSTSYVIFRPEQVKVTDVTMIHQDNLFKKIARMINPPAHNPIIKSDRTF